MSFKSAAILHLKAHHALTTFFPSELDSQELTQFLTDHMKAQDAVTVSYPVKEKEIQTDKSTTLKVDQETVYIDFKSVLCWTVLRVNNLGLILPKQGLIQ